MERVVQASENGEMPVAGSPSPLGEVDFRSIVDLAVDAILVLDPSGGTLHYNHSFLTLWDISEGAIGSDEFDVLGWVRRQLRNPVSFTTRLNAEPGTYDDAGERLFLEDGRIVHSVAWPLITAGVVAGQVWNFRDITDRIQATARANEALLARERRFRALVENATDLITVVRDDWKIVFQSPSSERALGYRPNELIDTRLTRLIHPIDLPRAIDFLDRVANDPGYQTELDIRLHDAAGNWHHFEVRANDRRLDPEIGGFVLNSRDVTIRQKLEVELAYQANHDPLTGLLNRRGFFQELENAVAAARGGGEGGALLLFDIDDFKDINDSLGHQAGDEVLVSVALILQRELAEPSLVSRLGGDEFAVVLRGARPQSSFTRGLRLLGAIRAHTFMTSAGEEVNLTTSLGLVNVPHDGKNVEELMSRVDLALYEAKARGRNQASRFSAYRKLESRAESRVRLRSLIRAALKEDRLLMYGQPILDLRQSAVSHYELLLRLRQENGKLLAAQSFIGLAERSGLITPIDMWVVGRAIELLNDAESAGQVFAVNVSAKVISRAGLANWIKERIKTSRVDTSRLVFEVTEADAITDIDNAQRFMHDLKDLGCRFALDDFGVGFSSLQRLRRLPVDFLKIDGTLIRSVTRSPEDRALVQSVVAIAKALHMQTIAEFVEQKPQVEVLHEIGVDYVQGNYVGRPRSLFDLKFQLRAAA